MPEISVERTIGATKRAIVGGLNRYNTEKLGRQKHREFAVSLRDKGVIVGGVIGGVWMTVLFIRSFWIDERYRSQGYGTALIRSIEDEARRFGAIRSFLDTLSVQAPDFYRTCGYEAFGAIDGYPGGVTRHWLTKAL